MNSTLIIKGNNIFDSISDKPFKGAVVVNGNKIIAVDKGGDGSQFADSSTKVIDAGDRLVSAGFHDSHVHLLMAGMFRSYANLLDAKSEDAAAKMLKEFADKHPTDDEWIIGFSWYHVFWDEVKLPTKESLDKYFPDKPVFLLNAEAHGAWVNSKALEVCGIDKNTENPSGGEIFRDENGEPTGFLNETAAGMATKYALSFKPEREKQLIKSYMESAREYGITSCNDVQPYFHGNMGDLSLYSELDKDGELTVRIHAAPNLLGDLDEVLKWKEMYTSDRLKVDMVKQFLDGVCTTHTALLLDEYEDAPGNYGIAIQPNKEIVAAVPEAHKKGLSIKLHSCGDASARMALDAYEEGIRKYGKNQTRHAIEHNELVDPADIPRYGELGVIPSVQPEHIALTQTYKANPYPLVLGKERADRTWPFRDLLESAGVLAIGSDCPVVDANPFLEIYRGVTRVHNDGEPKGGWNPTQKLTLAEMLKAYTYGSAYGVRREHEMGSIKEGNFADLIILNNNPFDIPESELINGEIDVTIMDGNVVYERQ